ncbi:amino acid efflux permease RhtB family protein [Marinobacterium nitratireducens]|uniref:Amino acid efflux permease RhtB family protein n=1 Tax=Marinobacterium nitratireducens TaxID=518897 RepID=A0A917ZMZ2_9GAMM|nr:LysE family transporter [Marinobacterium nitratireducens]GGO87609.1 amino acid efflux permease RhtB family protein [Marinobacterium nitratireducens]
MTEWMLFAGISLLGAMLPGANMAIVLRNTLNGGLRSGFVTAAGLATALLIHASLSLVGIAALISQSPALFGAIRWLGGAYLLYMGVVYLLSSRKKSPDAVSDVRTGGRNAFAEGLLISLFNPKVLLFFLAMFSQVLEQDLSQAWLALYGLTPVTVEFCWLALVVVLLTRPPVQAWLSRVRHRIEGTVGVALMALGIKVGLG